MQTYGEYKFLFDAVYSPLHNIYFHPVCHHSQFTTAGIVIDRSGAHIDIAYVLIRLIFFIWTFVYSETTQDD